MKSLYESILSNVGVGRNSSYMFVQNIGEYILSTYKIVVMLEGGNVYNIHVDCDDLSLRKAKIGFEKFLKNANIQQEMKSVKNKLADTDVYSFFLKGPLRYNKIRIYYNKKEMYWQVPKEVFDYIQQRRK